MKENRKLKILVVAAACHPDMGSEPGVGFNIIKSLSRFCELDVICGEKENNKKAIERELLNDEELQKNVKFYFIPRDQFSKREKLLIKAYYPFYYFKYRVWMKKAFILAKELAQAKNYDISHQLTMIGYREPGYLWKLNLPFVWGPVGGNGNVPIKFLTSLDFGGALKQSFRSAINYFQIRNSKRVKKAFYYSKGLMTVNSWNREVIKQIYGLGSTIIPISTTTYVHPLAKIKKGDNTLKFVCSGKLISSKNIATVLYALSNVDKKKWTLDILGEGPLKKSLDTLSKKLGINENISWHGHLPKKGAIKVMSTCDILLFPSLIEGSPGVVSEALSLGLPVVCFNKDGQRDMVDDSCGILISVSSPSSAIRDFTLGIERLLEDDKLVSKLSKGALDRSNMFTAEKQIPKILDVYHGSLESF